MNVPNNVKATPTLKYVKEQDCFGGFSCSLVNVGKG